MIRAQGDDRGVMLSIEGTDIELSHGEAIEMIDRLLEAVDEAENMRIEGYEPKVGETARLQEHTVTVLFVHDNGRDALIENPNGIPELVKCEDLGPVSIREEFYS